MQHQNIDPFLETAILSGNINALKFHLDEMDLSKTVLLKEYLQLAVDNKQVYSIFYILNKMRTLKQISGMEFLNEAVKYCSLYDFNFLMGFERINLSSEFSSIDNIKKLNPKTIQFILKSPGAYSTTFMRQLFTLPLHSLIKDNVLFDALEICFSRYRINFMADLASLQPHEIESLLNNENTFGLLSWCLASGVNPQIIHDIATKKNADLLSIVLIAASYPNSKFTKESVLKLLQQLDPKIFIANETHILLAEKLNNVELYKAILKLSEQGSEIKIENIQYDKNKLAHVKTLQGALRVSQRADELYPKIFGVNQPYSFWMTDKPMNRFHALLENKEQDKVKKMLGYLAVKFIDEHHIIMPSLASPLFLATTTTTQHVSTVVNFESIMNSGYLLSETARTDLGIMGMPTVMNDEDRKLLDQQLVCTAPYLTAFNSTNYFCQIKLKLYDMPLSYLKHSVIKLGDYVARSRIPFSANLTPNVAISSQFDDKTKSCRYTFTLDGNDSISVDIAGKDEIFHGINGFKESLCHIFYIINSLPDTDLGKKIKNNIVDHFTSLQQQNGLSNHLNAINEQLFKFMEIDFTRGLPLSFEYLQAFIFNTYNPPQIVSIDALEDLIKRGSPQNFKMFFSQFPFLKTAFIFSEMIKMAPPNRLAEVMQVLEETSPSTYLAARAHLNDFLNARPAEVHEYAVKLSLKESKHSQHNLGALAKHLQTTLADPSMKEERLKLMNQYKDQVIALRNYLRTMYADITFAGNNSKMREILTNPDIIYAFTKNNQGVLAAILAFEIEAKLNHQQSKETFITTIESQQSLVKVDYTLGTVLLNALSMPQFFVGSAPLNTPVQSDEKKILTLYIQQKLMVDNLLQPIEESLINLNAQYDPKIQLNEYLYPDHDQYLSYKPEDWKSNEYQELLSVLYEHISDESFSANPDIPREVNHGMHRLLSKMYPNETIAFDADNKLFVLNNISSDELLSHFLSSSYLLETYISHLLFDTLHFGVALTRQNDICKIQLNDKIVSFNDLISSAMQELTKVGVNSSNAIVAEQLALRVKMLESWCITHDKLSPSQNILSNP